MGLEKRQKVVYVTRRWRMIAYYYACCLNECSVLFSAAVQQKNLIDAASMHALRSGFAMLLLRVAISVTFCQKERMSCQRQKASS